MSVESLAGGRYAVERLLGHGGMALVYLAQDSELDRPVAIKLLAENLAADSEFRERFQREARAAARLSHPNIVNVYDTGEEDGRPYIVMECVRGHTLAEELRLRGGTLPVAEAVDTALQACAGLAHAHDAGLVHRDVKPQNLLVREDGAVKIADFGIAQIGDATRLTQAGSIMGTAAYLAPEQAQGEPVSAAADIYSLGAVLYELLAGRPPYEFASITELIRKQNDEPITPISDLEPSIPAALEDVVMKCLARNPAYRPASAAELARQLAEASAELPTRALPDRAASRATEVMADPQTRVMPGRRPDRRALGAVAVVALLLLALAIALSGPGEEPTFDPAVRAPAPAATPAEDARNLADWLRAQSG